nr:hypothetical protein [Abalone asfa-like virus]
MEWDCHTSLADIDYSFGIVVIKYNYDDTILPQSDFNEPNDARLISSLLTNSKFANNYIMGCYRRNTLQNMEEELKERFKKFNSAKIGKAAIYSISESSRKSGIWDPGFCVCAKVDPDPKLQKILARYQSLIYSNSVGPHCTIGYYTNYKQAELAVKLFNHHFAGKTVSIYGNIRIPY